MYLTLSTYEHVNTREPLFQREYTYILVRSLNAELFEVKILRQLSAQNIRLYKTTVLLSMIPKLIEHSSQMFWAQETLPWLHKAWLAQGLNRQEILKIPMT